MRSPRARSSAQTSRPSRFGISTSRTIASIGADAIAAEGLLAVRGQLDLVALELQRALERAAQLRLVIHDQYAHVLMLPRSHKNMMRAGWTSVE